MAEQDKQEITRAYGPYYYAGMHTALLDLVRRLEHSRVTHVMQIERPEHTVEGIALRVPKSVEFMLTERALKRDTQKVLGITRVLATSVELSHHELHKTLRAYMINQTHMLDFGPTHCDTVTGCDQVREDDEWYRVAYVNSWRIRFGLRPILSSSSNSRA
jgi:hypothetical protein